MKLITYIRVSTARQAASRLGLEAQRAAIDSFISQRSCRELASYVEVESGKNNARPELLKALHHAKVTGATLLIAKLDRLSRNAAFLLTMRDSGAKFIAADIPDATELTVGILALVAEQERTAISARTKEALRAAKARGARLGNPNGAESLRRAGQGNVAAVAAIRRNADEHASNLLPVLQHLKQEGKRTLQQIADELNSLGMLTPRGGRWHRTSVRNLLMRVPA